jgi:hypothetical protein
VKTVRLSKGVFMKLHNCICCGIEMGLVAVDLEGTDLKCEQCLDQNCTPASHGRSEEQEE